MQLRIAIVVHGRFHAFDLAREMLRRGHDVTLFTNYPAAVPARFGIPARRVRSFLAHGVLSRAARKLAPARWGGLVERCANSAFGRWTARQLRGKPWDVVHCFSGVAEEAFLALRDTSIARLLVRASSHIACQRQILEEEQHRAGSWTDKPSDWIVAREQREYGLADGIVVLGSFPYQSFLARGAEAGKLHQLHLGVQLGRFKASPAVIDERQQRIRAGAPLRILNVGTFCLRKGAIDFLELIRKADPRRFRFRFIGPVSPDARHLQRAAKHIGEFPGKRPHPSLPTEYTWGDLFLLPTLEDGFPVVVTQALAGGLPVIVSANCGPADLVETDRNGWVVPIRRPDLLLERLLWCDTHREELAQMVTAAHSTALRCDWSQTACEFEQVIRRTLAAKARRPLRGCHAV